MPSWQKGEVSAGKWSAQVIEEMPNGWAAKFTTLILTGADGIERTDHGLTPDIAIDFPKDAPFAALEVARNSEKIEQWFKLDPQLRAGHKLLSANR